MKKTWYSVLATAVIFLVSCYEVNEEITLNEKGSGTYVTKMDMSALIQMMQTMVGEEEIEKSGLNRPIDTTILLREVMDSAKDVPEDQKNYLARAP